MDGLIHCLPALYIDLETASMDVSYFQFRVAGPEFICLSASILLDCTVLQLDLEMVSDAVYPISHSNERRRVDAGTTHATHHRHWN